MSTPAAAARAVEVAVAAAWGSTTAVAWPNVPFTPPATASWLKVDFIWGDGTIATKGSGGLNTVRGILQLGIFGPKDGGDGTLQTLAETARAMFNRVKLGDVWFGACSGPVSLFEEKYRTLIVSAPFKVVEP